MTSGEPDDAELIVTDGRQSLRAAVQRSVGRLFRGLGFATLTELPLATASGVWADTAYRSKKNERHLARNGFVSHIHTKKPKGKPMSELTSKANAKRSKVRARVEHVFARQKGAMGLSVRTIGMARANSKIGMANLVDNFQRLV